MQYPTRTLRAEIRDENGDVTSLFVQKYTFSTAPVRIVGIWGYNQSDSDLFIQIHGVSTLAGGEWQDGECKGFATSDYSLTLPAPIGLDALTIAASTTQDGYTAAGDTPISINVILVA